MKYFLTGFMGSGKTTVGKLLATRLCIPFIDSDSAIETEQNTSISELFSHSGESHFRELEKKFIDQLTISDVVISCGGGLPCYNELMNQLLETGTVIYLETSAEVLIERLQHEKSGRPLFADQNPGEFIKSKLAERESCYRKANIHISTDKLNPEETTEEIIALLNQ